MLERCVCLCVWLEGLISCERSHQKDSTTSDTIRPLWEPRSPLPGPALGTVFPSMKGNQTLYTLLVQRGRGTIWHALEQLIRVQRGTEWLGLFMSQHVCEFSLSLRELFTWRHYLSWGQYLSCQSESMSKEYGSLHSQNVYIFFSIMWHCNWKTTIQIVL